MLKVISTVAKNSKISVPIQGHLQQELQEWTFPDKWSGHLPWRLEHHLCHNVQRRLPEGLGSSLDSRWLPFYEGVKIVQSCVGYKRVKGEVSLYTEDPVRVNNIVV